VGSENIPAYVFVKQFLTVVCYLLSDYFRGSYEEKDLYTFFITGTVDTNAAAAADGKLTVQ
jgi:hypothetical protein